MPGKNSAEGKRSQRSASGKDWKASAIQELSDLLRAVSPTHRTNFLTDLVLVAVLYTGKHYQPLPVAVSATALLLTVFFVGGCFVYAEWRQPLG